MALTLEQYADYLDTRGALWPAPPPPVPVKAKPHLPEQPGIKVVLWTVYGTLLNTSETELKFWPDNQLMLDVALDKTITEFKMWISMSRKPGQPAEYMRELYKRAYDEQRMLPSAGEKYPETLAERVWESLIKKLFLKDYKFDAGFFGSLNEYSRKVAYFFHASMQGTAAYPGAAAAVAGISGHGIAQGFLADGQCFTPAQVRRGLKQQDPEFALEERFPVPYRFLSFDRKARKPSDHFFRRAVEMLGEAGIEPGEVLHVGSNLERDIVPARKFGMKTALFAGDKTSLVAPAERLKEPASRPDVLVTELPQLIQVLG